MRRAAISRISITSAPAFIDIHCPADVDNGTLTGTRDGSVEISDLLAFLYFLERANEELERASLEKRSFIPHMVRSLEEEQL